MPGTSAQGASWKRSWRVCIPEAIGIRVSGRLPLLAYRLSCDRSHSIRIYTFRKSLLTTCCAESSAQSRRRLLTDHRPLIFKHQHFCRRTFNLPIRSYYPFPFQLLGGRHVDLVPWQEDCSMNYGRREHAYIARLVQQRSRTEAERYLDA
jgi:hypothetical protein